MNQATKTARAASRKPKQSRSKAKYDAIVRAAAHVVKKHGYGGASTVRIAAEAGVSVGTLYAYFRHKDDIFSTCVDQQIGSVMAQIALDVANSNYPSVEAGISHIMSLAVEFTAQHRSTLQPLVGKVPGVYDGTMLHGMMPQLYAVAEQFYRSHGLVSNSEEAKRLTYILSGAVSGFFVSLISDPNPPLSREVLSDELAALVMGYIVRYRPQPG